MDLIAAINILEKFKQGDLTRTLSRLENAASGLSANGCAEFLSVGGIEPEVLTAASEVKRIAGQINVTIHALGILMCLPHILEQGETVQYVSLGAGNTGRKFDLETNYRIAEFKFISWQGGAESIRQNGIFKDYFELLDEPTEKRKFLYLLGTQHALKFFNGRRALGSVLSKNQKTSTRFRAAYGDRYSTVREFFDDHRDSVKVEDISGWVAELVEQES